MAGMDQSVFEELSAFSFVEDYLANVAFGYDDFLHDFSKAILAALFRDTLLWLRDGQTR